MFLNGEAIPTTDAYGGRIVDDSFFVMFNASDIDLPWTVPSGTWAREWVVELDTDLDPRARHGGGRRLVGRPRRPLDGRAALGRRRT